MTGVPQAKRRIHKSPEDELDASILKLGNGMLFKCRTGVRVVNGISCVKKSFRIALVLCLGRLELCWKNVKPVFDLQE